MCKFVCTNWFAAAWFVLATNLIEASACKTPVL